MMQFESEKIEFKSQMLEDLYKEVIAFANTDGGIIYVGIDNEGNLTGIDNIDETYTRMTNGIRDAIQPDVTMFVRYVLQDNHVIRVEVGEGNYKPYYLKSKGLKPSGVFVRQGASSVPASPEQIRQMIKESDGDDFERLRSSEQNLTFHAAENAFLKYGVDFQEEKYAALGIRNLHDGKYTNLAWILSDQCQHTVKTAVFGDDENTLFKDAREFKGSIFQQLDETYSYLQYTNRTAYTFQGLQRIEQTDYPEEALREALLNALIHREYSFSGSIIIKINERSTEFISLGGLLPGLSPEDIRSGISMPRNRNLAEIFHRLHLIEAYGTGMQKIFKLYQNCPLQPRIEITPNVFKLILPNRNAVTPAYQHAAASSMGYPSPRETGSSRLAEDTFTYVSPQPVTTHKTTLQMQSVLKYLEERGEMTEYDLQKLLDIKKTRAYLLARQMQEKGLIQIIGRGETKRYKLKK